MGLVSLAQLHRNLLQGGQQVGLQAMCSMRTIFNTIAFASFGDGQDNDFVTCGHFDIGAAGCLNSRKNDGCRAGLFMQANDHDRGIPGDFRNVGRASRSEANFQLRNLMWPSAEGRQIGPPVAGLVGEFIVKCR